VPKAVHAQLRQRWPFLLNCIRSVVGRRRTAPTHREPLQALRRIWLTVLCPGWKSLVSNQLVFDMNPSHLLISEDVFLRFNTVRIVKAAGNYADLVAHRTSKGKRAATTRAETPFNISRRCVFRQPTPGPKQIVCAKHDKHKEGGARLPLTPAAVAIPHPEWIALCLIAKVAAQASPSNRHSLSRIRSFDLLDASGSPLRDCSPNVGWSIGQPGRHRARSERATEWREPLGGHRVATASGQTRSHRER
jgi:hypothetical protein